MLNADALLTFWFGPKPDDVPATKKQAKKWFRVSKTFDADIDRLFGGMVTELLTNGIGKQYSSWLDSPRGRLALIIAHDQFPRNLYRGTKNAFAGDETARSLCVDGIKNGEDLDLRIIERSCFYLPLQHAEDLKLQDLSLAQYQQLLKDAGSVYAELVANSEHHAQQHRTMIQQFGRFPHRNEIMQRESTADEIAFLAKNNNRYGQS